MGSEVRREKVGSEGRRKILDESVRDLRWKNFSEKKSQVCAVIYYAWENYPSARASELV